MIEKSQLSTKGMLVQRALNHDVDQHWIDWAISKIVDGCDSDHLQILAGETPPFNQFELIKLVDKTLDELGLDWSNTDYIVKEYTVELLEEMLEGIRQSSTVLSTLKSICIELDHTEYLYDFYLLYFAQHSLKNSDMQLYWPKANRSNIEAIITDYARKWIIRYRNPQAEDLSAEESVNIEAEIGLGKHIPFWKRAILQGCILQLIQEKGYENSEDSFEYSIVGQAKVPRETILTFWTEGGEIAGTEFAKYWIVQIIPDEEERQLRSGSHYYLKGRFEILAHGANSEEASRLRDWWQGWAEANGGQTALLARWLGRQIREGQKDLIQLPKPRFINAGKDGSSFKPMEGWSFDNKKFDI